MSTVEIDDVRARFLAAPGDAFDLSSRDSDDRELFPDKKHARKSLKTDAAAIDELQDLLYATQERALLIVLQGMDTAGKSGVIRHVFAETSPLGMKVKAFKAPSKDELARDYLWRVHEAVPPKGFIGIFDRSHYEDVLVAKVRELAPADMVEQRYEQINQFEKLLTENGVTILKFMLHLGHEEQGERLKERITEPHKRWKFNPGDLDDRKLWPGFMAAYETMVNRCSTPWAPWYVIPADSRTRRNAAIARIVRGALEDMKLDWPNPDLRLEDYDFS
ncbi:MAG: polyphosphate kinase [Henriciella sp.]|jgi:PPK2 family polyphosphate:nucleotide phosphotransferase|uniref:PPK2 family polyphosphate kinase n=1 Tax=Henriciella sp. TaxID=1968823 RepID=UPI000C113F82|nr:PPK2 family polyphosphate kinase [Henriciella sp.]MAN73489.1 polyphosphate kinase [Henriciella sp.]MBF34869.1 polyphosphate kinase [Hyphomonadaceae bacterium]MBK74617.1 polyphosphate kinase [Henriciella sp.]PHR78747.1 MAG: polyphosphate kinase [Henriciella sp.]|tara:strand:- start:5135 stop:5962 length:828 start_codon:yes stop_codon:yes gene_type:complete